MNQIRRKFTVPTRDFLLLASSVVVIFGCIADVQGQGNQPQSPAPAPVEPEASDIGGDDGLYSGSSFTGHRSLSEFGVEIQQNRSGFAKQPGANTLLRITTYSFLHGDPSLRRRVRIHAGNTCFSRGRLLKTHDLHPAPASQHSNGVASNYLHIEFSLAERVLVHEILANGDWVEANCTVTQRDNA